MIKIEFGDLIIEQVSDTSGVFSGDNLQVKWRSYARFDSGFGTLEGDSNNSLNNQSAVIRTCFKDE